MRRRKCVHGSCNARSAPAKPAAPVESREGEQLSPACADWLRRHRGDYCDCLIVSNATAVLRQSKEKPRSLRRLLRLPWRNQLRRRTATDVRASRFRTSSQRPPPVAPMTNESRYKISGIMKDPDGKPVAVLNAASRMRVILWTARP